MSDIKRGDRVRVVIEGEVSQTPTQAGDWGIGGGAGFAVFRETDPNYTATIEKIEPPVEVFQTGDTVRSKGVKDCVFTLGHGGYFDHLNARWIVRPDEVFTSKSYEKVDLAGA